MMNLRQGMVSATWDRKESPARRAVSIQDPSLQDPSLQELEGKLESERRHKESLQAELHRVRAELQASRTGKDQELWAEVMKVRADLEETRAELMSLEHQVPGDQANQITSIFISNMENPQRIKLKDVKIISEGEGFGNKAVVAGQQRSHWQVTNPDEGRAPTFTEGLSWGEQQSNSRSPARASPGRWGDGWQKEQANVPNYSSWTTSESKGYGNFENRNGTSYSTSGTNTGSEDVMAKLRRAARG